MKTIKHLLLAAVAVIAVAGSANAQFKFGPRVGINVNSLHFNESIIKSDNRTGFNAGLEAEFTVPVIGIGFDASVMYVRRNAEIKDDGDILKKHCDYFEIPINVKWKMNIPLVAKVVKPYLFTGPSFAFLTSKRAITEAYKYKSVDTSWNFGLGLEFFSHFQVSAYYGFGLNKSIIPIHVPGVNTNATPIDGKTHCWTVTAAWLF